MAKENTKDITTVRDDIDAIDNQVLDLLKERLALAKSIGQLKDESKRAKWDPLRERQIYQRLTELNKGVFPDKALHSIFHEIITTCRLS
ncbi:MAG: chorismate mutase, partial [Proteobacteria bacterium]|nr:chorismate mutase [Pseudomonadota bacterium]